MADKSKLWYIENNTWLEGLSKEDMLNIDKVSTMRTSKKGQYIYFPEEPSSSVYFLKEGRVKIGTWSDDGKEIIKAILNKGEIFGELSLTGEGRRDDFAEALEDNTTICALSMKEMEQMMVRNPQLGISVTKLIGLRRRKMERRLHDLIFKDVRTRIVEFLRDLAKEQGTPVGDEIMIKHKFTHQDIANLCATSRQTVTVVLNELRDQDVIYMERKKFLIRDISKLK